MSRELQLEFPAVYAAELRSLADLETDGLVRATASGIEMTTLGGPLLRVIAMRFDPLFVAEPRQHAQAI